MRDSAVTIKGQTTLPKPVRQALNLQPGDRVRYQILDGEVRLTRLQPALSLAGALRRAGQAPVSLDEMEAAIAKGAADSGAGQG